MLYLIITRTALRHDKKVYFCAAKINDGVAIRSAILPWRRNEGIVSRSIIQHSERGLSSPGRSRQIVSRRSAPPASEAAMSPRCWPRLSASAVPVRSRAPISHRSGTARLIHPANRRQWHPPPPAASREIQPARSLEDCKTCGSGAPRRPNARSPQLENGSRGARQCCISISVPLIRAPLIHSLRG